MTSKVALQFPAYKTQWDPEAREIQEATHFDRRVTDLCLSYLFSNTTFRSPREFISYFQHHESLDVPAGQELAILDISVLNHDREMPVAWMNGDVADRLWLLVDTILSPLAKTSVRRFASTGQVKFACQIGEGIACTYSIAYTLSTEQSDLIIRLSDLFRLMVMSNLPKVEFAPGQKMCIWGLTQEEAAQPLETEFNKVVTGLLKRTSPSGCEVNLSLEEYQAVQVQFKQTSCQGLRIAGEKFSLSIADGYSFPSASGLLERLLLGRLVVPPHQKLLIGCSYAPAIVRESNKQGEYGFSAIEILCQQLLAPFAYTMNIEGVEEAGRIALNYEFKGPLVAISAPKGFILEAAKTSLMINLDLLGRAMISERRSILRLAPDQELALYGLTTAEKVEMDTLISRNNFEEAQKGLVRLFYKRVPIGFTWAMTTSGDRTSFQNGMIGSSKKCDVLVIRALGGIELRLERPDGFTFIASIVNHSHPDLLKGLRELDPKAMRFLLFRAFFYYLCQDFRVFRSDEFPTFFKPEKVRPLVPNEQGRMQTDGADPVVLIRDGAVCQFIDESTATKIRQKIQNPALKEAIDKCNASEDCHDKLDVILDMSPDEFDKLAVDQLPPPVQLVLKEIQALATQELSGSPFITTHLPAYLNSLPPDAEGSLHPESKDQKDKS